MIKVRCLLNMFIYLTFWFRKVVKIFVIIFLSISCENNIEKNSKLIRKYYLPISFENNIEKSCKFSRNVIILTINGKFYIVFFLVKSTSTRVVTTTGENSKCYKKI